MRTPIVPLEAWLAAQGYRQRMWEYTDMPVLQVWSDCFDLETVLASMQDKEMKRFYTKKLTAATEQSAQEAVRSGRIEAHIE